MRGKLQDSAASGRRRSLRLPASGGLLLRLKITSNFAVQRYTLGRRAKWKDYVDLYFIFKKYSFKKLVDKASLVFGQEFNEKLFREQLAYFEDLDFSERINFMLVMK
jgi:hypothetical protein